MYGLLELLKEAVSKDSQLHLCVGQPPAFIRLGKVEFWAGPKLSREALSGLLEQGCDWALPREGQSAVGIPGLGRCQVHVHRPWVLFRPLPADLPADWEKLNLPPVLAELMQLSQGLLLLGGQRGSGLSTTLAFLLESLRLGPPRRILSVGPGLPYVQGHGHGLLGACAELTDSLLDTCDVVLLPVTDSVTAQAAIQAAEEGRLVIGVLRAAHVPNLLDRLLCWLPTGPWSQRLADVVRAAYCQRLLVAAEGPLPISEFVSSEVCRRLLGNPARVYPDCLEGQAGCWSLLHSLQDWLDQQRVTPEEAESMVESWS